MSQGTCTRPSRWKSPCSIQISISPPSSSTCLNFNCWAFWVTLSASSLPMASHSLCSRHCLGLRDSRSLFPSSSIWHSPSLTSFNFQQKLSSMVVCLWPSTIEPWPSLRDRHATCMHRLIAGKLPTKFTSKSRKQLPLRANLRLPMATLGDDPLIIISIYFLTHLLH